MSSIALGGTTLRASVYAVDMGQPNPRTNRRIMTLAVHFSASDADAAVSAIATIRTQLRKAKDAARAIPYGSPVTLVFQPGTTNAVTFDLLPDANGECGYLAVSPGAYKLLRQGKALAVPLTLSTSAYGRGAQVNILDGTTTYTNGQNGSIYVNGLEGDVPGLVKLRISDVSTNSKILQRLLIGQRSADALTDADFASWVAVTPESGASDTDSDSVSTNIATVTAGVTATQLGTFAQPSGAKYADGPMRALVRARDDSTVAIQPTGLTAVAGNLLTQNQASNYNGTGTSLAVTITTPTAGHLLILAAGG